MREGGDDVELGFERLGEALIAVWVVGSVGGWRGGGEAVGAVGAVGVGAEGVWAHNTSKTRGVGGGVAWGRWG